MAVSVGGHSGMSSVLSSQHGSNRKGHIGLHFYIFKGDFCLDRWPAVQSFCCILFSFLLLAGCSVMMKSPLLSLGSPGVERLLFLVPPDALKAPSGTEGAGM